MWTISGVKEKARGNLKKYFWEALVICFLVGIFTAEGGGINLNFKENIGSLFTQSEVDGLKHMVEDLHMGTYSPGHAAKQISSILSKDSMLLLSVIASVATIALILSIALGIFVTPALTIGKDRFFVDSSVKGQSAGIGSLLWGFKHNYLNGVWVMFVMNFFITLGTFFFIIPGIYLSLCYRMVPYLLAENPDMRARDALKLSSEMMKGNKFGTLMLGLSFIGWLLLSSILGLFTFGFGSYLAEPYIEAAFAELYLELRKPYNGRNGFGSRNGTYDSENRYYGGYTGNGGADDVTKQYTERDAYADRCEESGASYHAEGGGSADYGHYHGAKEGADVNGTAEGAASQTPQNGERGGEVKRSEGGPGRGYYLNGVFYPYTEDELRELRENEKR